MDGDILTVEDLDEEEKGAKPSLLTGQLELWADTWGYDSSTDISRVISTIFVTILGKQDDALL